MMDNKVRFKYSKKGKRIRGVLCMLTFLIFMFMAGILLFTIMQYGVDSAFYKDYDFYKTGTFMADMGSACEDTIWNVSYLDSGRDNESLYIINVGENEVDKYNLSDMVSAYIKAEENGYETGLNDINTFSGYRESSEKLKESLYNYRTAKNILYNMRNQNAYLYMDSDTFVDFFMTNGEQNYEHRFSQLFSEEAYFLFVQAPVVTDNETTEDENLLDITIEENKDYDEDINLNVSMEELGYAVYDPEQELFYSSWDDYFERYDSYTYSVKELYNAVKYYDENGEKINSLIFPMLRSYNSQDIWQDIYSVHENTEYCKDELERKRDSAFLYYIELDGRVYANVESPKDIVIHSISYRITNDTSSEYTPNRNAENELGVYYDAINTIYCNKYDMYFGVDEAAVTRNDPYKVIQNIWSYKHVAEYFVIFAVLAVIAFIMLMVQAVSLIRTAGRTEKGSSELSIYWFDNICTELWWIIYVVTCIMMAGLAVGALIISGNSMYGSDIDSIKVIAVTALSTLPFGMFFMQLTLSLARRVKAHNFMTHSFFLNVRAKGILWFKRKNGVERLVFYGIGYIGAEAVIVFVICLWTMQSDSSVHNLLWLLIIFFVIMWIITSVFIYHMISDIRMLNQGIVEITKGNLDEKVYIRRRTGVFRELADGINHISDGLKNAVETSLKDERMKTELITNVSHDLKTPLTSIINYINLLKSEKMPSQEAEHYVEVLDAKAQRLSQLAEDLVEAAKATSGNIELQMMPLAFDELMRQALGEFEDKFAERNINVVASYPEEKVMVMADGRRLYRILDNVLQNAYKYAMEGTRIYIDLINDKGNVMYTMKNISAAQLNITADELMERFTRGDSSRTTEGSGLGLSIAKDLTRLMGGSFDIELDGDLFKVILQFSECSK